MVERYVDIVEVISSILITPTNCYLKPYLINELIEIEIIFMVGVIRIELMTSTMST